MKFEGQSMSVAPLDGGIVELTMDLKGDSTNKFNALTLKELREVVDKLKSDASVKGLLVTSAKDVFVVGADVTEFGGLFKKTDEEFLAWVVWVNRIFSDIEDLPFPTVTAINGMAFGGGLEFPLSTCYRVASTAAKVGVPEVKLGIFPGWGGTVRLARLAGADNAIEWVAGGEQFSAENGYKIGVIDAVVEPAKLRDAALDLLKLAMSGKVDWKARQAEKKSPVRLDSVESMMAFTRS